MLRITIGDADVDSIEGPRTRIFDLAKAMGLRVDWQDIQAVLDGSVSVAPLNKAGEYLGFWCDESDDAITLQFPRFEVTFSDGMMSSLGFWGAGGTTALVRLLNPAEEVDVYDREMDGTPTHRWRLPLAKLPAIFGP